MSHGSVARKRYRRIDHRGHVGTLGQGWTTGHQKRNPAPRKHACSTACHPSDCNPSVNAAGTCHPTNAAAAASQQNAGCESTRPTRCTGGQRNSGPTTVCTNCRGKPCNNGITGAPTKIKGGASVMRSRCWTMWTVSNSSSNAARGEPNATQIKNSPRRKLPARQPEMMFTEAVRR